MSHRVALGILSSLITNSFPDLQQCESEVKTDSATTPYGLLIDTWSWTSRQDESALFAQLTIVYEALEWETWRLCV